MKRAFAVLCLGFAATTVQAEGVDINLSSQALRGVFSGPLTNIFPRLSGQYELGGLLGEEESRNYTQFHGSLLVTGDAGAQEANVTAGLGGRLVALDTDEPGGGDATGGALALGGMFEARLPAFNRLGAIFYAYGAPKASTFGDFEGYFEYAGGIDYQVLRDASVYVGYRQIKVDVENVGDFTVDNGWHLGLKLNF